MSKKIRQALSHGDAPVEARQPEHHSSRGERPEPVTLLSYVCKESMATMMQGDIILLDGTDSLRELVDRAFFAILACPICGKLDLVTQSQYSGTETVICGYDDCACHFRIDGRQQVAYLRVN